MIVTTMTNASRSAKSFLIDFICFSLLLFLACAVSAANLFHYNTFLSDVYCFAMVKYYVLLRKCDGSGATSRMRSAEQTHFCFCSVLSPLTLFSSKRTQFRFALCGVGGVANGGTAALLPENKRGRGGGSDCEEVLFCEGKIGIFGDSGIFSVTTLLCKGKD